MTSISPEATITIYKIPTDGYDWAPDYTAREEITETFVCDTWPVSDQRPVDYSNCVGLKTYLWNQGPDAVLQRRGITRPTGISVWAMRRVEVRYPGHPFGETWHQQWARGGQA